MFQEMKDNDLLQSQIAIVVLNTEQFKNIILDKVEDGEISK
jgi:hypothetical protein